SRSREAAKAARCIDSEESSRPNVEDSAGPRFTPARKSGDVVELSSGFGEPCESERGRGGVLDSPLLRSDRCFLLSLQSSSRRGSHASVRWTFGGTSSSPDP